MFSGAHGAMMSLGLLAYLSVQSPAAFAQRDSGGMPGDFDYYILSLSWSPTFCESRGSGDRYDDERDSGYDNYDRGPARRQYYGGRDYGGRGRADNEPQCAGVRPYAFVLHGLWPQYERRGWPQSCRTRERPWVDNDIIDSMMDIMPSKKLVIHEYKTHGTCSGLQPREFFAAARKVYQSITIPDRFRSLDEPIVIAPSELQKAFMDANPTLPPDSIQVACNRDRLQEVRLCFTKDFQPRACSQSEIGRKLCSATKVIMPPVRGAGVGPKGGPTQQQ